MPVIIFVIFLIATTQSWWLIGYLGLLLWLEWLGVKGWRMVLAVIATWLLVTLGVALAPDSGFAALIGWSHRGLILGLLCILGLLGYSQLLELLRRHEVALPDRAPGLLSRVTDGGGPAIAPQPDRSLSDAELTRYARHIVLRELGGPGQAALRRARVLIVGAGGLGAPVCQYLAAAGLGRSRLPMTTGSACQTCNGR